MLAAKGGRREGEPGWNPKLLPSKEFGNRACLDDAFLHFLLPKYTTSVNFLIRGLAANQIRLTPVRLSGLTSLRDSRRSVVRSMTSLANFLSLREEVFS
jgi:hypothetical protein